nr:hypothetical protein [Bacteroidota bacterium]
MENTLSTILKTHYLKLLILPLLLTLYSNNSLVAQTYTFTNCGQIGNTGPSQTQCNTEYTGTSLAGAVTVASGIQEWTVPATGLYKIENYGAQGSTATGTTGGLGAYMSGEFLLTQGDVLRILVGQNAPNTSGRENLSSSGGGGSFVTKAPHNTNASILVIAGGGGGTGAEQPATSHGSILTSGQTGSHGTGGTNGNAGTSGTTNAGSGAGFFTDAAGNEGGDAYVNGGAGGNTQNTYSVNGGGFGGGGSVTSGSFSRYAGGGGYSGGSGSNSGSGATSGLWGGGGGSFNSGANQNNLAGANTGHGQVVITVWTPCTSPPTAGITVASDTIVCSGGSTNLSLNGNSTGAGMTYQWQSSLDNITWTNIPGATNASSMETVTATTYFRCEVTCSNVSGLSTPAMVFVNPLFSGTYTIGTTGNFANFTAAIDAMECGIDGPVIFNVMPGTYTEQIQIDEIAGASATNTITFKGDGPANTKLIFAQNVSAERYTIRFNGASWVTIDSMAVEADATGSYGWVMHFTNDANNIIIKNCELTTDPLSTSSSFIGIVASSSSTSFSGTGNNANDILIENNIITGGYYNIRFNGVSATPLQNIHIIGNQLLESHYYGVYYNYVDQPILNQNEILMRETGNASGRAVHLTNSSPFTVTNNAMVNMGYYGMYITNSPASAANRSVIANNNIGGGFRSTGSLGGGIRILGSSTSYIDIFHNSINVDSGNNAGINLRISTPSNIRIKNNSLVYSGTGTGYAMYINSAGSLDEINNNNYHSDGTNFVYYNGSNRANLAALQAVNAPLGNDTNSVSGDPVYLSHLNLMPIGPVLNNAGTPIASIATDILGVTRSTTTPDIGAYEFTPLNADIALVDAIINRNGLCYNPNDTVIITIENNFGGTIDFSVNPLTAVWSVTGPVNTNGTILVNTGTLNNGATLGIEAYTVDMTQPGVYTLNAYIEPNASNESALNDT